MADKMAADCKPVKGKVKGPIAHQLCATHGHILDVDAKTIIAKDLKDYVRLSRRRRSTRCGRRAGGCEPREDGRRLQAGARQAEGHA